MFLNLWRRRRAHCLVNLTLSICSPTLVNSDSLWRTIPTGLSLMQWKTENRGAQRAYLGLITMSVWKPESIVSLKSDNPAVPDVEKCNTYYTLPSANRGASPDLHHVSNTPYLPPPPSPPPITSLPWPLHTPLCHPDSQTPRLRACLPWPSSSPGDWLWSQRYICSY